jgi:hypothetical protein
MRTAFSNENREMEGGKEDTQLYPLWFPLLVDKEGE